MELFVDQFFNTMIDVTLRDLQTTKQGVNVMTQGKKRNSHLRYTSKGLVTIEAPCSC